MIEPSASDDSGIQAQSTAEGGGATHASLENHKSSPNGISERIFVIVYWPESVTVVPFIFQNEKIFRPGRVESKMGDGIAGGSENRIVELAFQILGIFSKHYFVARTA